MGSHLERALARLPRRLASLPGFLRQRWTLGRPQARGTADFD